MKKAKAAGVLANPGIAREFVSVAQAEEMTSVSRWTWRVRAYRGDIASVKCGRRLLIPMSEIRRCMSEGLRPRVDNDGSRA
jgi:hypothetical protein